MTDLFGTESSAAVISECGVYRYRLTRVWSPDLRNAAFVMLNPSTADATDDDATIRRCVNFAKSWGCGGIDVVNLFAYRSRHASDLETASDPVGPDNDRYIRQAVEQCCPVVCAWGADRAVMRRDRAAIKIIESVGVRAWCLGLTKNRHPRHPLFLSAKTELVSFC